MMFLVLAKLDIIMLDITSVSEINKNEKKKNVCKFLPTKL